jgi:integrase/recombinase XerD
MTKTSLLGPWVRRFLLEYLVSDRNLTRNTQRSYRDTLSPPASACGSTST